MMTLFSVCTLVGLGVNYIGRCDTGFIESVKFWEN